MKRGYKLLEQLANEALAEHRVGNTKPMTFNEDGQIVAFDEPERLFADRELMDRTGLDMDWMLA